MDNSANQSKSLIDHNFSSILFDYLSNSSTPGLRKIAVADNLLTQLFWIVSFTAANGFMLYFIIASVSQYLHYPTETDIEIQVQHDMIFPAVTLCSANPYRVDKMNASLLDYAQRHEINLTNIDLESLVLPLVVELFNNNQSQELINIGFQLNDMLIECSYNGIDCSSQFIHSLSSVYGNCYTFNRRSPMKNLYTLRNFSSSLVLLERLSMTFYIPRQLYFPVSFFDEGLIVELHDNNELPLIVKNGLRLQPGLSHTISFSKSQTNFLSKPFTNCTSLVHDDLHALYETTFGSQFSSNVNYSQSTCLELCQQAFVFAVCSCILPYPFYIHHVWSLAQGNLRAVNACIPYSSAEKCALEARQKIAAASTFLATWCFYCTPQCALTNFPTVLSSLSAPSQKQKELLAHKLLNNQSNLTTSSLPSDFATNYDHYLNENYLHVQFICSNQYVTVYNQNAKQSLADTVSAVGGLTGIWIGLNVLGVIEFGEFLIKIIVNCVIVCKHRRRRRLNSNNTDTIDKVQL